MPVRSNKPAVHVDPAAMPAAGAPSSYAAHPHGKACTGPPAAHKPSPSRRKSLLDPASRGGGGLASVLRPTASSANKACWQQQQQGPNDDVGGVKARRPILKRTQGAPASVAHLKGASLLSPQSPRIPRFAKSRAAVTAASQATVLRARGLQESPSPRPAPANRPRTAAPFATESIPVGVKSVPKTFEAKRVRHPVADQPHAPERQHRRKLCKPVTPRLFTRRAVGKA